MTTPKYKVIKQHIFQKIELGQWPEHSKVPSENELTAMFSVSRMTARRALQELTDDGVLMRTQGAGTFVASFKSQSSLLEIRNIAAEIKERGHRYGAKQVLMQSVLASEEVAISLNIERGKTVFYSEILHLENDVPIQLEQRFVNPKLVPDYIKKNFVKETPHEYLSKVAPLTEATHEIEAILADQHRCQLLSIAPEQPCLQVKRRTWSRFGVVSLAILTSPGNKYRLGGHLTF